MAQFYASCRGNRGEVHRLGHKTTGAHAEVRGWNDGVMISARWNAELETNEYHVYVTHGSNGGGWNQKVAIIRNGIVINIS